MIKGTIAVGVVILLILALPPWLERRLPSAWNPFTPLHVTDAPTFITRYKMKRLASEPADCLAVLQEAQKEGYIRFTRAEPVTGNCPLFAPLRVAAFGDVRLRSSFLASCSLALSSTMFVAQSVKPLAATMLGSPLTHIDHVGSYACRNIYHRPEGRLSEHATADALDITGFRLKNGEQITVLRDWPGQGEKSRWLRQIFQQSCQFYGNALGPAYNAAHASHFHLGMRGFGLCR